MRRDVSFDRGPVINNTLPPLPIHFPSPVSPPRHGPLSPHIHRGRRNRAPRRRALPPAAVLSHKTPQSHRLVQNTIVQLLHRRIRRGRWPAHRQLRSCCGREGPGILLAGQCNRTSHRDAHRTGQKAGRRDGQQDRKCHVCKGFGNGLCHCVWHETASRFRSMVRCIRMHFSYCPPLTSLTLGMPTRKASLHRIRLLSPHSFLLPIDPCFLSFPTQPHYCVSGSKNYARLTNSSLH